jgi:hypothetical protein
MKFMDADTVSFFLLVLLAQTLFTAVIIFIVASWVPQRLPLFRFVAPTAIPLLLFAFAVWAWLAAVSDATPRDIGRLALAHGTLWLCGLVWATVLMRLSRRLYR